MRTLTETRIEIADRHTTLCAFGDSPPADFAANKYVSIYQTVAAAADPRFSGIFPLRPDPFLDRLSPVCTGHNLRFWRDYLGMDFFPKLALSEALPLQATISPFLTINLPNGFTAKVSPLLRVLLYPTGWSSWLSLRITVDHTLGDLAALLEAVFRDPAFVLSSHPESLKLESLFDHVSRKLRDEVFAGDATRDTTTRDRIVMTTVLSKHGGVYSLAALNGDEEEQLKFILHPFGRTSRQPLRDLAFSLEEKRRDVNYLLFDGLGRFTWLEKLLAPERRNHQHLTCYHNNNFLSLTQAWHLEGLLASAYTLPAKPESLNALIRTARERLSNPLRKNASLIAFLQGDAVKKTLSRYEEAKKP